MNDDSAAKPNVGGRPRSKSFLAISLENAYAQLGVSPLATSDEITNRINALLGDARRRVRAKASKPENDPDEQEILRLQKIDESIGDPKRRAAYDQKYPQNILLTVQPSSTETAWLRHRRAGLISEWIRETLGEDSWVPTPRCLRLWVPTRLDRSMLDSAVGATQPTPPIEAASPLSMQDLQRLSEKD